MKRKTKASKTGRWKTPAKPVDVDSQVEKVLALIRARPASVPWKSIAD